MISIVDEFEFNDSDIKDSGDNDSDDEDSDNEDSDDEDSDDKDSDDEDSDDDDDKEMGKCMRVTCGSLIMDLSLFYLKVMYRKVPTYLNFIHAF